MVENEPELEVAQLIIRILRKPVTRRKFYDQALLEDMLKKVKYNQGSNFSVEELEVAVKYLLPGETKKGEIVFKYNVAGTGFYIILHGSVSVQIPARTITNDSDDFNQFVEVALLQKGSSFGETASIAGKRTAQVVATEHCYFAILPYKAFERILKKKEERRLTSFSNFLLSTPYFKKCSMKNIYLIQYYFHERAHKKGQILCNSGDIINNVFLIKEGEYELKINLPKTSSTIKKERHYIEDLKSKALKGAKGLSRQLRIMGNTQNDLGSELESSISEEVMEISLKTIGCGELFGHADILFDRNRFSGSLKCVSMTGKAYLISKKDFNKWIRKLYGLEAFLLSELRITQQRTKEYVKLYRKIKENTLSKLTKKNFNYHSISLKHPMSTKSTNMQEKKRFKESFDRIKLKDELTRNHMKKVQTEMEKDTSIEDLEPSMGNKESGEFRKHGGEFVSSFIYDLEKGLKLNKSKLSRNQILNQNNYCTTSDFISRRFPSNLKLTPLTIDQASRNNLNYTLNKEWSHEKFNTIQGKAQTYVNTNRLNIPGIYNENENINSPQSPNIDRIYIYICVYIYIYIYNTYAFPPILVHFPSVSLPFQLSE